jgi:anti-sigma factor RsiW
VGQLLDGSAARSPALARHLATCPRCALVAERLGRVTAALDLLAHYNPSATLLGRANVHALRMVSRQLRFSKQASRLAAPRPRTGWLELLAAYAWRLASPTAAALLIALIHTGWYHTMQRTEKLARRMADVHFRHHVDPDWSAPNSDTDRIY